jgi:L-ascorbate metabolism protein UlaG (beta-lactamase superfamily)
VAGLETVSWPVAQWKSLPLAEGETALWWMGQSGFAVRSRSSCFLIDPYLSNSLARKYAGTRFPHVRMMPAPTSAESVSDLDLVFCTHRHTDHMDRDTLTVISRNGRGRFVVPRAIEGYAVAVAGLDPRRIIAINAGETIEPAPGLRVAAVPSAHEELAANAQGQYPALGYVFSLNGVSLYHSGDCVPYGELKQWLAATGKIDLAILPVNGRDAERTAAGVLGNFTMDEALRLRSEVPFARMIVSHFGMFDFNTVDPAALRHRIKKANSEGVVLVPDIDVAYKFSS